MAQVITKDNERHPSHPAYPKPEAKTVRVEAEAKPEVKTVKVPERKTE